MSRTRVAVDTSVVVAALLARHDEHEAALLALQKALAESDLILPVPTLVEAYAVLTRLPAGARLSPADAHRILEETFRHRAVVVGLDGDDGWALLSSSVPLEIAGGSTYDAHIVACARKAAATTLLTFNRRHFERCELGGIELVVPRPPGAQPAW